MGKCCGASKSQKRAQQSRARQRELGEIAITLDQVLDNAPSERGSVVQPIRRAPVRRVEAIPRDEVPQPKPKVSDLITPPWKQQRFIHEEDRYGEIVFDGGNTNRYHSGKVPGVEKDSSARGLAWDRFSPEDQQMVGIAKEVLNSVRSKLPRGPFNNYLGLPETVTDLQKKEGTDDPAPGWWNAVVDIAAGKAAAQLKQKYPKAETTKLEMACFARATQEVGGGVCSKFATLTSGTLTTVLPPGSEIVQVFSRIDHEFVIARIPGSKWFVVDPWCQNPQIIPFVDCSFSPDTITKFIPMVVKETAPHPFGIDVDDLDWAGIIEQAKAEVPEETPQDLGHVYGHQNNTEEPQQFDKNLKSVKPDQWG